MATLRTTPRPAAAQIARAVATFAWTAVLVIGAPWALARFFGWPLPRQLPDWTTIASTPVQLIDPHVILNFFVCLAWIAWATVAAYLLIDVIDLARGLGQRTHRLAPLSAVAGRLVSSATLLIALARPPTPTAVPPRPAAVARAGELTPLNSPAPPTLLDRSSGPLPDQMAPAPQPVVAPPPVYVVQRGDCLWTIAETHLGSGFRWTEIYDLNRDRVTDPDLIDIGWTLTLPTDAAPTPAAALTESTQPRTSPPPTTAPPASPVIAPAPHPTTTTRTPKASLGPSTNRAFGHPRPVERARHEPAAPQRDIGWTWLEGTGVVAATGLLLAALTARRRRLAQGVTPAPATALESTLLRSADVPLIRWAGQQLAQLVGRLPTGSGLMPVAVELSEEAGLEILWDQAASSAPAPWQAIGGGWSWTCAYDPDQPVPDDELPAPIPALVTIGQRDGRQLMINLEAFGSVSVVGDRRRGEDFVRSMVVELGGGDDLADAYVYVDTGTSDLRLGSSLSRVRAVPSEQLLTQLASARSTTQDQLRGAAAATTVDYRAGRADRPPIEATVAVSPATDDTAALLAQVGPGASAVVLGQADASATITLDAAGTGRLEPLGVTFNAVGLSAGVDAALAELLTDYPPRDVYTTEPATDANESSLAADVALPFARPGRIDSPSNPEVGSATAMAEPRLLVKVLGKPGVVERPELSRRELMVVVYMACAGRPVHNDDIRDAIWGGEPISAKSAYNLVARARSKLGLWDGMPILAKPVPPHNTLSLAVGVTTDLALLRALTAAAAQQNPPEALATIGRALALIDGAPFDAPGYEWAHLSLLVADASTAIEETVLTGVRLAMGVDDPGAAQAALVTGLRALPEHDAFLDELERTGRDSRPTVGTAPRITSTGS